MFTGIHERQMMTKHIMPYRFNKDEAATTANFNRVISSQKYITVPLQMPQTHTSALLKPSSKISPLSFIHYTIKIQNSY